MEDLIKQAFLHVDVIGPHVQEGHYDLIGPNGEIILPSVWEKVIEPDYSITMHMWPMDKTPLRGQMHPGGPPGGMPAGMRAGHPAGMRPGHHPQGRPMHPAMMGGMRPAGARPAGAGGVAVPPPPPHVRMGGMGPPGGIPIRPGPGGVTPMVIGVEPPRKKSSSKSGASLMGWMAGKPTKSSSKKYVDLRVFPYPFRIEVSNMLLQEENMRLDIFDDTRTTEPTRKSRSQRAQQRRFRHCLWQLVLTLRFWQILFLAAYSWTQFLAICSHFLIPCRYILVVRR